MNKTLIALAVSAAAVATGANAAEIYNQDGNTIEMGGRAEARLALKDGKAEDNSRVRLNFLGTAQITDSLYGVGFYEGEFTTNDNGSATDGNNSSSDLTNRYLYGGIGGAFGEVTYGKNDGALGVITDFTDIMAYHGNSAAYKIAIADRSDNMVSYKGQFADLGVKASYRFADGSADGNNGYTDNDADGYSLSAIYAIGETGVKLGAGYADGNEATLDNDGNTTGTVTERNQYMLAASYTINDLYFAGTFVDGEDQVKGSSSTTDKTGYELAAAYTMGQTVFTTSYNYLENKTGSTKEDAADNIAIDATYYFKPNFRGYVSYNFNLLDDDKSYITKADAEDELALGLRYDF
ncbi:porin [Vibrio sp. Isolate25]|uniref:porin n=1 Tax=Vibrio sp. Isolate25 TaxID=2908535 RepID=UPI001EFEDE66|nr:porin [Vibrio sp. Isolate25]MCG9596473.1 porin [Vibrio sp. Isolate25]